MEALRDRLGEALLRLDRVASLATLREGLAAVGQVRLADEVIAPALSAIGEGWETGAVALSQVYMAGRILEQSLEGLLPGGPAVRKPGVIGIAVLEDHHVLGKRIIHAVLGCAGYDVHDLGAGLTAEEIVDRAVAARVDLLLVSVLMFDKALRVPRIRELLFERGVRDIRIVVGGAPFVHDPLLWRRVGADDWGRSAADALRVAARMAEELS